MAKKIGIRILVLILVVVISSIIYNRWFWKEDLKRNGSELLLDLMEMQDTVDIIYFGESSNFTYHPDDSLRIPISGFIDRQLPDQKVGHLTKGAYHAGLFCKLIDQIDTSGSVNAVIVTLNMRTFDQAAIHSPIETALQMQGRMFEDCPPLWNRVMLTLNAYDDKSKRDRDRQMWVEWTYDTLRSSEVDFPAPTIRAWCELPKFVDSSGNQDMAKRALADHYVKAYAFQIDTLTNPRIRDFDQIVSVCKEKDLDLFIHLLPENMEYADSLVGPSLTWLMRQNRDLLVNRYRRKGAVVIDNLELLEGERYIDKHWTTEHYDQEGRTAIAIEVAKAIRSNSPE
jgi:hypothetical protein